MLALAIVIASLLLIALLRFGVIVEYSEVGLELWLKAGFIRYKISLEKSEKKPKKKRKKKKKKEKEKTGTLKPGSLSDFLGILKALKKAMKRLKRRLLLKQLTLYYVSAGENPATTAIVYGAANAVFGTIAVLLERNFRIKRRDFRAAADFNTNEQKIYAKIIISIAVWEVFYILFALLPIIWILIKSKPGSKKETTHKLDRKDGQKNGESPDK